MRNIVKSIVITGTCAASLAAAGSAFAAQQPSGNGWYTGVSGDFTWLRHSETGGGGNVDIGYRSGDVRLEAQLGYHGADGDAGYSNTHYFTAMANGYYDFNTASSQPATGWRMVPYIGAGVGSAMTHYGRGGFSSTWDHHDSSFAYQGMAGLTFVSASMPRTAWTVGYRYLGTDEHNLHASNLELGVRYHF